MKNMNEYLSFSPEVREAMEKGKPIVALESTIISHGMPYPKNVETAVAVEQTIRENGAVPATIAIIKGRLMVGLTPEELLRCKSYHETTLDYGNGCGNGTIFPDGLFNGNCSLHVLWIRHTMADYRTLKGYDWLALLHSLSYFR